MRGDLHGRDQLSRRHDGPIERGEHLERVDPVEQLHLAGPDVQDARVRRDEVHAALVGSALLEARAADGGGEPQGRLVLVEVARLHDEHGDGVDSDLGGIRGRQRRQVGGRELPTLPPSSAAHAQVARQHGAGQLTGGRAARDDPLEPHPLVRGVRTPLSPRGRAPPGSRDACTRSPSRTGTRRRRGCRC